MYKIFGHHLHACGLPLKESGSLAKTKRLSIALARKHIYVHEPQWKLLYGCYSTFSLILMMIMTDYAL